MKKGQTLTAREYWVSFVLLRLNLGWIIFAIFRGITGIATGDEAGTPMVLATYAVGVLAAHVFLMSMRSRVESDFRMVTKRAVVPLQTPILILGGILLGVFTPTEAGGCRCVLCRHRGFLRSENYEVVGPAKHPQPFGHDLGRGAVVGGGQRWRSKQWCRCPMRRRSWRTSSCRCRKTR